MFAESKLENAQVIVEKLRAAEALIADAIALTDGALRSTAKARKPRKIAQPASSTIRLGLNERAFVKNVARTLNGGPRKFVALVAFLAKGKPETPVSATDVQRLWNRNKAKDMLGMAYNGAFASRAKSEGWVNPTKYGVVVLDSSWRDAFASE